MFYINVEATDDLKVLKLVWKYCKYLWSF